LLNSDQQALVEATTPAGEFFQITEFWKDHFPDWYGNLYLSEDAARRLFGKCFDILHFAPRGMANHQDVIIAAATRH
jgi:hypothetical protein